MMFLETDAILLLWALKVWRNYFLGWNLYRGGFLHLGCCLGCAGQPDEFQCLSCLQPHMFMQRTLQWALPMPAPHSLPRVGLPSELPVLLPAPRALVFYFLLWSSPVLLVLLCLCDTHQCLCCVTQQASHWALQASLICGLVASLPCRKPYSFSLELVLKLIAAQSLTAVLISDLKLLDLVTLSSLGRSVFIIIVSKEGLGDY